MSKNILYIREKLKSFIADEGFYTALLLIMVAVASFGLGRQSITQAVSVQTPSKTSPILVSESFKPAQNLAPAPVMNGDTLSEELGAEDQGGEVVASKSGTKYHLPTCSGAKSIKPENLITFTTREEAEAAGYTPAANCKGLE